MWRAPPGVPRRHSCVDVPFSYFPIRPKLHANSDLIAFDDHKGYTQLFDGVSLKDWVGNPEIWRVENGAIVGRSTKKTLRQQLHLLSRPGRQGLRSQIRNQSRIRRRQTASNTAAKLAASHSAEPAKPNFPPYYDWVMTRPPKPTTGSPSTREASFTPANSTRRTRL